jgi:ubiquinone/menaquinone biosynthesis C-methylase UbiE
MQTLIKSSIKHLFKLTHTLSVLDKIVFTKTLLQNRKDNNAFKKQYSNFILPSNYFLYETFKLNYRAYKEDGELSAQEIVGWTDKYLPKQKIILEWGCGVARIVRHIEKYITSDSKVCACDINAEMIDWCTKSINKINFTKISQAALTPYQNDEFNLIYALSVFTHIPTTQQQNWLQEMARILQVNGIFLFTTHGFHFSYKLNKKEQKILAEEGAYTIDYHQNGHRMMTTYNVFEYFKTKVEVYFHILEFYDGQQNPNKVGGQDLWIVQKK